MNNKIIEIQDAVFRQIQRLDDNSVMGTDDGLEIARSNALTNAAATFIKAVNAQLAVINAAEKSDKTYVVLRSELGLNNEKEA